MNRPPGGKVKASSKAKRPLIISKKPQDKEQDLLRFQYFPRARSAFEAVLRLPSFRGKPVLLPAYIGYGKVEGSGVFDPVRRAKKEFFFYRMKGMLEIDLPDAKRLIQKHPGSIVLLIHYFGFKDRAAGDLKTFAKKHGCIIVEDYAHGLFTFFADPVVECDFAFFSLHKMLPVRNRTGGLLLSPGKRPFGKGSTAFYEFNVNAIAEKRRRNYDAALEALLKANPAGLTILRPERENCVPESFPILLESRDIRNALHSRMNAEGFGLISLYHELIAEVDSSFRVEHDISNRITNLPIHQDADPVRVRRMIETLCRVLPRLRGGR